MVQLMPITGRDDAKAPILSHDPPCTEAFDLICRYAEREHWLPIGWRDWCVGPWRIRVNGTAVDCENIPAWHVLIEHQHIVSFMLIHQTGGTVGGWAGTEEAFISDMKATLDHTGSRPCQS